MKSKTGRNDSCPCGSGKKYKNCCCDKETVSHAYKPILSNEDDILKYTEFVERWDRSKGTIPSFIEYLENAGMYAKDMPGLTDVAEKIKLKSSGRRFKYFLKSILPFVQKK